MEHYDVLQMIKPWCLQFMQEFDAQNNRELPIDDELRQHLEEFLSEKAVKEKHIIGLKTLPQLGTCQTILDLAHQIWFYNLFSTHN